MSASPANTAGQIIDFSTRLDWTAPSALDCLSPCVPGCVGPRDCDCSYGFINTCLKSLVVEKFGEETWLKLRDEAGVQDTFLTYESYKDEITMQLVAEACKLLGVKPEVVLRQFGEYFFEFCKRSGYDHMLRTLGGNLFEFTENLDALHSYLALSYKEMNAPSFRVERNPDGTMLLHYYSDRRGLCHIVPGIIEAVAKDFFNSEITMEIVNQLEELERTGKKEHVVFLVTQWPATEAKSSSKTGAFPRTQSIQTLANRHNAMIWIKEPLHQKRSSVSFSMCRSHWETIRGLVRLGKGKLLRGFEPVYPMTLNIDLKTFCQAFPFHIVFDEQLVVHQAGVNLQRIVPGLQNMSIHLNQYFSIVHPEVTFTISSIRKFINSHFVLQTIRDMMPEVWNNRPMLQLRGQMIWMPSLDCMLYQASPLLRSLQELEERDMHISDIAPHDVTRDLILLNQQRLAEIELSNQLERKKEELRLLSQHLEEERRKTENLLYAMLPKHVANQLKEGKTVEAGEFKECTILFSDVVTFTNICSMCEPIQIVLMLNSMYLRFDRLTTVHNVYKVETIGDAYMVVGGVPIPVSSHAERVANFALGMILAAREVINPVTGGPIQIRVGLHSGPVLAGVVGEKMPRYCLFGDTVNTASRMESHGLPDKIHLSPTVYDALKNKGFVIQKRGEIEVKGKGRMTTYFLERNLGVSEQQIMGLSDLEAGIQRPAVQRQHRDDLCLIPMKYGDSLSEPPPTSHMSDPQTCPAIKPRDSESYGSLHTDDQLEDGSLDQLKDTDEFGQTEVKNRKKNVNRIHIDSHVDTEEQHSITAAMETNYHNKHTRTRFCVVL
ncbi:guanylate cyclase soluble subunit beta-2-like [Thunnus maccoyii]|uniref:guanylate cyclase soluble subunit beta-2-like n=1 Tax=Thunnus maccoyii TaxID=8240 RepID=UPI001C4D8F76|nr:guanylate cyclase soluble subunit beta-2-like [Thunnus maccoyii]